MKKNLQLIVIFIITISSILVGSTYTENFDTDGNWAGGTMTAYNAKTYANDISNPGSDQFSTNSAVRETGETNSAGYAWRVDDNSGYYLRYECDSTVSAFSIYAARWDNSPKPSVTVRYSTNSGSSYTDIESFDGDWFTGDKVYKQYSHTFDTPIIPESGQKIYIEFYTNTGERMLYDDFSVTYTKTASSGSPDPEPTNHVTDFTATSDGHNAIDLRWSENDGAQAPSGYLIKASTADNISDPIDGTAVADNATIGSNSGAKNISHGTTSYEWSGLSAEQTYYFKIYPYTNSGDNIDYKTDGNVPSANTTTDAEPSQPNAWINEIHYDNASTDANEGVEVVIENSGNYTLSDFKITLYNGNGGVSYGTHTLNTFEVGTTTNNFTFYYKMISGIQNGPDGIALSYKGSLISGQFLSYDGSFAATDGDANGVTSTNIGVSEGSGTASSQSLQLTGNGTKYSDFTWEANLTQTWGSPNDAGDQSLPVELQEFNAIPGNAKVTLCWTTESETENLGFILSRKVKGESVKYEDIASYLTDKALEGHGSTSERHNYSYTDYDVISGVTYSYKIEDVDYSGTAKMHDIVVTATPTGEAEQTVCDGFRLQACYPNPFNPETTLRFELGEAADVRVQVYDLLGNLLNTLTNTTYQPGLHSLTWNGRDMNNRLLSTGIYFMQVSSSTGFSNTQKVVFLR